MTGVCRNSGRQEWIPVAVEGNVARAAIVTDRRGVLVSCSNSEIIIKL